MIDVDEFHRKAAAAYDLAVRDGVYLAAFEQTRHAVLQLSLIHI